MRSFKAIVEYDGSDFAGFQWQHNLRTVQGELENALGKRCEHPVKIVGAGRTDSGVHAIGQVISFHSDTKIPVDRLPIALSCTLPEDISVTKVEEVSSEFSARFSASSRVYAYLIHNRRIPSAVWRRYSTHFSEPLDVSRMQAAALGLIGDQDFASFGNELDPEHTTMREVMHCALRRTGEFVILRIEANAFLRGMVRTIAGTLIDIGRGRREPEEIRSILDARDRRKAGPSAPPQGLCLVKVRYGRRKVYARQSISAGIDGSNERMRIIE